MATGTFPRTASSASPGAGGAAAQVEASLQALVAATWRDLHPGEGEPPAITLASVLDEDLGFDSLGRMELLLRIERSLATGLPEETLQGAETVADLLQAIRHAAAGPRGAVVDTVAPRAPLPLLPEGSGDADVPRQATTLPEVLAWHVRSHADRTQIVFLQDGGEQQISYGQLAASAAAVAAGLQRAGVAARQTVAVMLPTCPEYFSTYFGILIAGAIPVPIYPPARPSQLRDHVLRHQGILDNAQAVALVTVPAAMGVARLLQARLPGLRHVVVPQQLSAAGGTPQPVPASGEDIAFIQYTSGSTGAPKGVTLTHANLLANIRAMAQAVQATPRDVFVSWLPLYHDMGLIGAWLGSLYIGCPLVVMPPTAFLADPLRWLQAITRWRGTLSAGPNFAYELCLKRIDDAALQGLDLASLRLAFNGAEAVSAQTVQRFAERFARCGLRPEAVAPVYGLAENAVGLLFPPLGRVPPIDTIQREAFMREHRAVPAPVADPKALRFVGCGRPLPGHAIRIVDEAGQPVGDRVEGRLEFRGPSATTLGYFRDPQRTARLFRDGWLDSGDLAYAAEREVYLTGRAKDIVIRGGRHLYPEEIEEAVGAVDGVHKGCVAVFGCADAARGTERLVVLAEVRPPRVDDAALRERIGRAVVATIGEPADDIVLAPAHTVLKTSSGKVRRSACRALYESGDAAAAPASSRRQWLALAIDAWTARPRQAARALAARLFGWYATALFWLLAAAVWLAALWAPNAAAAWRAGRRATHLLLRLTRIELAVSGLEHLPPDPCVLVSNHASYLDSMILVAALPRAFAFVAKRELGEQPVTGAFLRRLGVEFVERLDLRRAVDDATRMADCVTKGRSLITFPEGTFVAAPGLLPFHLGAFLAAARAGVPVVPVAIRGSRRMMPDGQWMPRRGPLRVELMAPIPPQRPSGELFAAAVRLREAAHRSIAGRVAGE